MLSAVLFLLLFNLDEPRVYLLLAGSVGEHTNT
jgi:hypothetical protein